MKGPLLTQTQDPNTLSLRWLRRILVLCLCLATVGTARPICAGTAYPEQPCLELLEQRKFNKAIRCMTNVYKQTKQHRYLLSLGLYYEKAGKYHAGQRLGESCYDFDNAVRFYRSYLKRVRHISDVQKAYLQRSIKSLIHRIGYAHLEVKSRPVSARIVLRGGRRKWMVRSPHRFHVLCPGQYRLEVTQKGFAPHKETLELRPKQALSRQVNLTPIPRRAFRMPAWGWTLVGGLGLGLTGGVLLFAAENRRQTLEAGIGQDLNWKENMQTAQGLSFAAVGLFVGAGIVASSSLIAFFARPPSTGTTKEQNILRQRALKPPKSVALFTTDTGAWSRLKKQGL